jgi:D-arabinose 1-dehydrogenase-like Zn-dependent alcohol dehydrogenase
VRERQPDGDTGGVGYSPYRKFKARTGDYVMVVAAGLVGVGLVAWAFFS